MASYINTTQPNVRTHTAYQFQDNSNRTHQSIALLSKSSSNHTADNGPAS